MPHIPQKRSLVNMTVEAIRQNIETGEWVDKLPSERRLSELFQVSRPTVTEAIAVLRQAGVVISSGRRLHRIRQSVSTPASPALNTVNFLYAEEKRTVRTPEILFYIDEIRRELQKVGLDLEAVSATGIDSRDPAKKLRALVAQKPARAWILCSVPQKVQEWFGENRLPSLVIGTTSGAVPLPSLDLDYRAIASHAAGTLLSLGHRRIACFLSRPVRPGDEMTREGFEQATQTHAGEPDALFKTVWHTANTTSICQQVGELVRTDRVSAILVGETHFLLTVVSHLLRTGVRIPEDVSLISRDCESYLNFLRPEIARYDYDPNAFARKLTRLVIQLSLQGALPNRAHRIIPEFRPGQSLAKIRPR